MEYHEVVIIKDPAPYEHNTDRQNFKVIGFSVPKMQFETGGTCESRNAERGTEVKCGPRAIITVRARRLYSLTQKSVRCLFQCRTAAKHTFIH